MLLEENLVVGEVPGEPVGSHRAVVVGEHVLGLGVREVFQAVPAGPPHELAEVAGRVERLELFVEQVVVTRSRRQRRMIRKRTPEHAVAGGHLLQEVHHVPRAVHPLRGAGRVDDAEQHGVADDLLGLPTGIDVVTDVGDAVRGQRLSARRQDRLLHVPRHPAVHTVADDEVERAQSRHVELTDVSFDEPDVAESECPHPFLPCLM